MLDVGTNNTKLLEDKLYLGLRQPRLEGEEYLSVVDEFMEAVHARWPKAVVQFEDFQMKWAFETLQRYRNRFCMFNDDVQGTAGVALAGLLGAVRAQGRPLSDFTKQKIVVVGAGSAGIGVLNMAKQAMLRMPGINRSGEGHNQFWVLDKDVSYFMQENINFSFPIYIFCHTCVQLQFWGKLYKVLFLHE
jgi:malate dehydrogenase (decarboxylating)